VPGTNQSVGGLDLLVCDEDLECRDEVCHRDGLVLLPLLEGADVVDKDDEVVLLALEVNLGLGSLSLSHDGRCVLGLSGKCGLGMVGS
jgi:hypothetical protein